MLAWEWEECNNPSQLLAHLSSVPTKTSIRKWRLISTACWQRVLDAINDENARNVVLFADRLANAEPVIVELGRARKATARPGYPIAGVCYVGVQNPSAQSCNQAAWWAAHYAPGYPATLDNERRAQACLIRDIFGNPFRPVTLDPAWRTSDVVAIARTIYDERQFEDMPVLGDALEDAGCDNADILKHCREPGEHVRGCWVVDLLLGKT
jgi:hypothetical protein